VLSWRRLEVLLRWLPDESATKTAMRDGPAWTVDTHLLAGCFDVLRAANWQRSGGKGRRPRPTSRPGDGSRERLGSRTTTRMTPAEMRARMAHIEAVGVEAEPVEVTE